MKIQNHMILEGYDLFSSIYANNDCTDSLFNQNIFYMVVSQK